MCLDGKRNDQMAFHALADYQNHVIGWLQWEQSSLGDGAVVRFPRIWMSSGECRLNQATGCLKTTTTIRPVSPMLGICVVYLFPDEESHGCAEISFLCHACRTSAL